MTALFQDNARELSQGGIFHREPMTSQALRRILGVVATIADKMGHVGPLFGSKLMENAI